MLLLMDVKKAIGTQLRELRLARGWTLREAAPHVGVAYSTLGQIENGQINTTLDTLDGILRGLKADREIDLRGASDALPEARRAVADRFLRVLPLLPEDHLDVFLAQLARWEARYLPSSE